MNEYEPISENIQEDTKLWFLVLDKIAWSMALHVTENGWDLHLPGEA